VLAKSPTGSGKTLAFAIPIVERLQATDRRPGALILAPTRELALQIVDDLDELAHARALSVAAVYGGAGIERQMKLARRAHILVATPGRLEDILQRRAVTLEHIKILVLDEADRMLDMGFRPAVDRIVAKCPAERQTLFFSATLDGEAGRVAKAYTNDARRHEHAPATDRKADIEHRFLAVERDDRLRRLVRELAADDRGLALVFVRTKRGADRLVRRLSNEGVHAVAMHGDKSQRQREKALAAFAAGRIDTLVATDVAARGIDVGGISHVINFDPPADREGYVHRVRRTGRAGRTGIGITFFGREHSRDVGKIADQLRLKAEFRAALGR
jgi:superfamily II DNA/RNA helicase